MTKPGADGNFLPGNWECVNTCRSIHHDKKPTQKKYPRFSFQSV